MTIRRMFQELESNLYFVQTYQSTQRCILRELTQESQDLGLYDTYETLLPERLNNYSDDVRFAVLKRNGIWLGEN